MVNVKTWVLYFTHKHLQAVVKLEKLWHISDLTDAIERVEILRDEPLLNMDLMQSFGVIYYIKEYIIGSVTLRTGLPEGDGEMIGVSVNNGSTVGDKDTAKHNRLLKSKPCKQTWKVDAAARQTVTLVLVHHSRCTSFSSKISRCWKY
jgi:hypothetical protein